MLEDVSKMSSNSFSPLKLYLKPLPADCCGLLLRPPGPTCTTPLLLCLLPLASSLLPWISFGSLQLPCSFPPHSFWQHTPLLPLESSFPPCSAISTCPSVSVCVTSSIKPSAAFLAASHALLAFCNTSQVVFRLLTGLFDQWLSFLGFCKLHDRGGPSRLAD